MPDTWEKASYKGIAKGPHTHVNEGMLCSFEECPREARQKGLCDTHYRRVRTGRLKPDHEMSDAELMLDRGWDVTESGCWEYRGNRDIHGYGAVRTKKASRVSYEHFVEPIPDGLHILHSCDNPPCINPEHLRVGTPGDNARDKVDRRRHQAHSATHCPNGHEYPPDDGFRYADGSRCRECRSERESRYERRAS